ncbi:hypothetical protein LLH03_12550 [bacterium]|nr:hypothetical protein [bacterium]
MKRLDATVLEAIAEVICGSGEGGSGGYASPGPYRTKSEIQAFFERAEVSPQGISSTRKWFTLEALQSINGTDRLRSVILRLASPKEYRGDAEMTAAVSEHLNRILQVEGLETALVGVNPTLRERAATAAPPKPKIKQIEPAPDFERFVTDSSLADILSFRWDEAQRCVQGGAHLSAIVMMGSVLEGALLHKAEQDPATAGRANCSPKDRTGKTRSISEWGLSKLIEVAHEVGWLQGDVKRFSHALRESRNMVHPYVQRLETDRPDQDTCSICWQVVRAAIADLMGAD